MKTGNTTGRQCSMGLALAALLAGGAHAAGDFEGVLDMQIRLGEGASAMDGGTARIFISKDGTRNEMTGQAGAMAIKSTILFRTAEPDKVYRLDEARKTYTVQDVPQSAGPAGGAAAWKVEKLGEETILGYKTKHVRVTRDATVMEMWTARGLMDAEALSRMQASHKGNRPDEKALMQALQDADADGMPLRTVTRGQGPATMTMEVVAIDKKSPPSSLFQVPADYTEEKNPFAGGMPGAGNEEVRKKMDEAMRNLSPEQRAAMERALKSMGPPPPR